ncbi:MAG TPA: outer membrane lipoprotein carrier protein LolA [Steroidobacteraceae bacterium]|nr:outer membrane lipoprotein carrier protein LolA [Steroidobacteraceae bacterium]
MRRQRVGMRSAAAGLGALLWLAAPGARAASADLDELMRLLAARREGQVEFVEQHYRKLLKRPVESSGILVYEAPDRLEKRTLEPRAETLSITGERLSIQRGSRSRALDLTAYPAIGPFVESMRATLGGNLGTLARIFTVDFDGDLSHWTLTLVPRDAQAQSYVSRVRIEGARERLLQVEILEADGDHSVMTLREHPTTSSSHPTP